MKKAFLLLTLILAITFSYSQNDCSRGDGTFQYIASLNITNLPTDFDKDDLINHIIEFDNITNHDLDTLNDHIILVYKTYPSNSNSKFIKIIATIEIYSILDGLSNSIQFVECVIFDCSAGDYPFDYLASMTSSSIPIDFDKNDFIVFITELDDISNEDLATLEASITSVYRAFPTAQSQFLRRAVIIEATSELFSILETLTNSIEHYFCIGDEVILGIKDDINGKSSIVFPNPITKNSVLKLKQNATDVRIELINTLGQLIHHQKFSRKNTIELKDLPIVNGVSFMRVYDLTNGTNETLKIVKEN